MAEMTRRQVLRSLLSLLVVALFASGCTPRLSPLYRDYRITDQGSNELGMHSRITLALEEAGWSVIDGVTSNIVATESRKFRSYGIYSMEVALEVSPIGKEHVRVFIHPYRHYFTGSRGKMPYLKRGLAKSVMNTLEEPFAAQGLQFAGTAQSRDKAYRQKKD